jgi:hypothetical protein
MKYILILFFLVSNLSCAQTNNTDNDKEIALMLCNEFTKYYSTTSSYENNRMVYIKNVEVKLTRFTPEKKENILRKLHELCPPFLEYSTIASKKKASSKGDPEAFKLWDDFIASDNTILWTENEKQQFLRICNYALSERKNSEELCECTINKISEKLSATTFLSLPTPKQGYLGGQVSYVYCSE